VNETMNGHGATSTLTDQVALVTGGGRGLGRFIAQALAADGAAVAVAARTPRELNETVAAIEAAGGRAVALTVDVTDSLAVEEAVAEVERRLGPVDLLVNNAGVGGPIGPTWEVAPDEWWRAVEINLRGTFLCARAVLPGMIARRRGRIVNVASFAGVYRWPEVTAYAVSKAAVIKLTENLSVEAKDAGVRIFAVHPGILQTGLTAAAMLSDAPPDSPDGRVADWFRRQVEAGQDVPPERAASLIVALARGEGDTLSGRYIEALHDLAALAVRAEEIRRGDLYTLRLRESAPAG
jgi:NAD(P)-dependent dehydrogenase (short-subunit alcohol dehydrogenase family)